MVSMGGHTRPMGQRGTMLRCPRAPIVRIHWADPARRPQPTAFIRRTHVPLASPNDEPLSGANASTEGEESSDDELPEYLRRVKWVPKKPAPRAGPQTSQTPSMDTKGAYKFLPAKDVRRALGVDYGRVHIGVAVSNLGIAPRPLNFIRGGGIVELMRMANDVVDVAVAEQVDCIVVGLPVTTTGSLYKRQTDSQQGRRCRNFAATVFSVCEKHRIGVFLVDERGTSQEAGALLDIVGASGNKRKGGKGTKGRKDSVAAALILSAFYRDPAAALRVRGR